MQYTFKVKDFSAADLQPWNPIQFLRISTSSCNFKTSSLSATEHLHFCLTALLNRLDLGLLRLLTVEYVLEGRFVALSETESSDKTIICLMLRSWSSISVLLSSSYQPTSHWSEWSWRSYLPALRKRQGKRVPSFGLVLGFVVGPSFSDFLFFEHFIIFDLHRS